MNQKSASLNVPSELIPYATQSITPEDIEAVVETLKSRWLTQGPQVARLESAVSKYCGSLFGSAVSNGTAGLHLACLAAGLGKGDLLWTSPNTFVASANCGLYCGAEVDFVDIDPETKNISVDCLSEKLKKAEQTRKIPKVLVIVHYAGHPCDMEAVSRLCRPLGITVIEDATHALGSRYKDKNIGACEFSDMAVFSFHAIKNIATGEGGMVLTNNSDYQAKLQLLRSHGITRDSAASQNEPWFYEQLELGFNYRLTDFQCALGISQLNRLNKFVLKRRSIVARYNDLLKDLPLKLPVEKDYAFSAWHLYSVEIDSTRTPTSRSTAFEALRKANIGANVHYIPVHLQPYYQQLGFRKGDFPQAEFHYEHTFSLPLYADLKDEMVDYVAHRLEQIFEQ